MLTSSNASLLQGFVSQLHVVFPLKDLRPLNYFLGVEVLPTTTDVFLTQHKYIVDLLSRESLTECKTIEILLVSEGVLSKTDGDKLCLKLASQYRSLYNTIVLQTHNWPSH